MGLPSGWLLSDWMDGGSIVFDTDGILANLSANNLGSTWSWYCSCLEEGPLDILGVLAVDYRSGESGAGSKKRTCVLSDAWITYNC